MKSLLFFLIFAVSTPSGASVSLGSLGPRSDNAQVSVSGYLQGYFDGGLKNFQLCSALHEHDLKKCIDLVVPDSLAPHAARLRGQCVVAKGKFGSYANYVVTGWVYSDTGMVIVSNLARCTGR